MGLCFYSRYLVFTDISLYVFTSGTTGYPKACRITHTRFYMITLVFTELPALTSDDICYNALPLYHTSGGPVAMSGMIERGCTLVLSRKFSASHYWSDAAKYNCTVSDGGPCFCSQHYF